MWFVLWVLPLWAAPQAAWDAALREFRQGYYPLENKIQKDLSTACEQGFQPACQWKKRRKKTDTSFFQQQCQTGDAWSCVISGWLSRQLKVQTPTQQAQSQKAFSQACKQKENYGCLEEAQYLHQDPKSVTQAQKSIQQLCKNNFIPACREWAIHNLMINPKQAMETLQQACRQKDFKACGHLGGLHLQQKNTSFAVPLLKQSCQSGASAGCYWLGKYHSSPKKSIPLYQKACDGYSSQACIELAKHSEKNKHSKKAATYYKQACFIGHPLACFTIGYQMEKKRPNSSSTSSLPTRLYAWQWTCMCQWRNHCCQK